MKIIVRACLVKRLTQFANDLFFRVADVQFGGGLFEDLIGKSLIATEMLQFVFSEIVALDHSDLACVMGDTR